MLTKDSIAELAKTAGITADELANAISDEKEVKVEVKTTKHYTDDEWERFEKSLDQEKKTKYEEGRGKVIKDLKEKTGLEFDGKNEDDFISNLKKKALAESGKEPDKRIKELENDLEILKTKTLVEKDNEINKLKSDRFNYETSSELSSYLPDKMPEGLTKTDGVMIMRNKGDFVIEDGKRVVKVDGQVVKNEKTREPVTWKDFATEFATERKWRTNGTGRGSEDEPGGSTLTDHVKARKMSELNAYFEEKNIEPLSAEAQTMINEAAKNAREAKEDFAFNE